MPERDSVRVVPVGELDLATVPILEARSPELREAGARPVLRGVRGLLFIDSVGCI
jgi:hypothetical protein